MLTSIDGFISTDDGRVVPGAPWNEEVQRHYLSVFTEAAGIVFGRTAYEQYYGHWSRVAARELPAANETELAWAHRLVAIDKIVISRTIQSPDCRTMSSTTTSQKRLHELKQRLDGDLLLVCGPELFAQLNERRLVDEYRLYVTSVAVGRGNHLFRGIRAPIPLHNERTQPFQGGMTLHYYRPSSERSPVDTSPSTVANPSVNLDQTC
jgi:dihydrofolate reductase